MSKFITVITKDQFGNDISIDSIDVSRIVRTKYIIPKRVMLVVLDEQFVDEGYTQVPSATVKKAGVPVMENKKVRKEGYYAHGVTDPDDIQNIYNIINDLPPGSTFPGFKLSDEFDKKMKDYQDEMQAQQENAKSVQPTDTEMLSDKEETIIKNIKETNKVVN